MAVHVSTPALTLVKKDEAVVHPFPSNIHYMNKNAMAVAQENFNASRPPIRTLNITQELGRLMRNANLKESIASQLNTPSADVIWLFE